MSASSSARRAWCETFGTPEPDDTTKRMLKRLDSMEKELHEARALLDELATEQRTQVLGKVKS